MVPDKYFHMSEDLPQPEERITTCKHWSEESDFKGVSLLCLQASAHSMSSYNVHKHASSVYYFWTALVKYNVHALS